MGVWIEINKTVLSALSFSSLPSWECGLKSENRGCFKFIFWSLPSWECGLKWVAVRVVLLTDYKVTPFVGVWIEIAIDQIGTVISICHSLRGSVD